MRERQSDGENRHKHNIPINSGIHLSNALMQTPTICVYVRFVHGTSDEQITNFVELQCNLTVQYMENVWHQLGSI